MRADVVCAFACAFRFRLISFALEVAAKTLSFFTQYFGQPYPLPKMDMARRIAARTRTRMHAQVMHIL
jgi:aminopeptidase N